MFIMCITPMLFIIPVLQPEEGAESVTLPRPQPPLLRQKDIFNRHLCDHIDEHALKVWRLGVEHEMYGSQVIDVGLSGNLRW